jgi:amino acid transporter
VNFDARLAFDFPAGAFTFTRGFFAGLGSAALIAMYDFLGYHDICYVGGEVRRPERVIPRAIVISVIAVAAIYGLMNLCIMAVIPWREAMQSKFIVAEFMERLYGGWAGGATTVLILWCAFASVFALSLGYSRIPFAAASEGYFFRSFARLHARGAFRHVSLLVVSGLAVAFSLLELEAVIASLLTARILIQFIGQILAVHFIRTRRREMVLPFRIWLYPLPSIVALFGWIYVFLAAGTTYILYGLLVMAGGIAAFLLWTKTTREPACS